MAIVEETLKENILKIGSTIKLQEYSYFDDYMRHYNEEATILSLTGPGNLSIMIKWKDTSTSNVSPRNVILVSKDWDS